MPTLPSFKESLQLARHVLIQVSRVILSQVKSDKCRVWSTFAVRVLLGADGLESKLMKEIGSEASDWKSFSLAHTTY